MQLKMQNLKMIVLKNLNLEYLLLNLLLILNEHRGTSSKEEVESRKREV